MYLFILFRFLDVFQTLRRRGRPFCGQVPPPETPQSRPATSARTVAFHWDWRWHPGIQWPLETSVMANFTSMSSAIVCWKLLSWRKFTHCLRPQSPQNKAFTNCFRSHVQDFDSNTQVCACVYSNFPEWNSLQPANVTSGSCSEAVRTLYVCYKVSQDSYQCMFTRFFLGSWKIPEVSNPWGYP